MVGSIHTGPMAETQSAVEPLVYPLSFAQRRLWFLDRLEPGKSVYNVTEAFRLKGPLNRDALARAVNQIIQRHDSLRTTFGELDGNPVQVVAPSLRIQVSRESLAHLPAEQREREAALLVSDRANQHFDLRNGPLIRVSLLQLAPDEHILLIAMQHIISEGGWSMSVFLRELQAFYSAEILNVPAAVPELPIQYGDYSVWQQDWLRGEVRDQLLAYWKEHLKSAPAVLDLPSDRPRPSGQSYSGAKESYRFPAPLTKALNDFSQAEGVTLFMTVLAAFTILLRRYSQQEDLVVGVPMAGRGSPETHDLIGFFNNTLPLRANLAGDPTFREMVRRIRQVSMDAYDHEDLPFEMIVDALKPERSLAFSPLFQVMFAYQNAPREELRLPSLEASPFSIEARTAMFDLTLFMWERPEGLLASLEYSTDLFEPETAHRMLGHLEVLLAGAMASPATPISRLPLLDESEQRRILVDWNATESTYPNVALQELIEEQARRTPEAVAVTCGGQSLTYRELNARANQLAAYLMSLGAGVDQLVGVCLERSADLVLALLAVMKTGGAYLPLDPSYPDDRIRLIAEHSRIDILIAASQIQKRLPDFQGRIISLDWTALAPYNDANPRVAVSGDHLAYVIYTSGSTGRPKGVAVLRKALSNLLCSVREQFEFSESDVLLGVTTISFDIAGTDIWLPLLTGARLVLADRDTMLDGQRLQNMIEAEGVTFLQATPATWRLLLESGWQGKQDLQAVCTGEAMPKDLARRLFPLAGRLWNMYGPTETTIWSTAYRVSDPDAAILIGRPIANTQTYILDDSLTPVPTGVCGELYIGGDGLARGYLHQEELTGERFVPNPFRPGTRLYKTGDLARYRPGGDIECLGRNDHQIKLRGFRIEPEEIRAALAQHPSVADAVAVLDTGARDGRIVAYVVATAERSGAAELREFLRRMLPEYMIPAAFVFLDALPLTPNGKVDRLALPAADRIPTKAETAEPQNELEARLKGIWEQTLGVGSIGVNDDFFDLGGQSFLAAQLFRDVNFCFHLDLPLATLFHAPTIRRLAQIIAESEVAPLSAPVVDIQPAGSRPPIYCVGALDGEILVFRRLANELGMDQPMFGLQPFRLPGPPATIEQLAAAYIEELRKRGEQRPFCLLGYSFGGLVAVEMALQLQCNGIPPPVVVLLDTGYPAGCRAVEAWPEQMRRFRRALKFAVNGGGWKYFQGKVKHAFARMAHRASARAGVALIHVPTDVRQRQQLAAESYRVKSYHGRVQLFRAQSRREFLTGGESLGWSGVLKNLAIEEVPGDHGTMNTGMHLKLLAKGLKECLRQPS
jgi:amino acid adenylation domain-containing protein